MKLLIVTDYKGLIRQGLKTYEGLSLEIIKNILEDKKIAYEITNFDSIINSKKIYEGYKILFTSAQNKYYKEYIEEVLYFLKDKNQIIPKYELLKCHEDKSFQERYKNEINLISLKSWSFVVKEDIYKYEKEISFPCVLKLLDGAGSRNVSQVKNFAEVEKKILKRDIVDYLNKNELKRIIKKYILKSKYDKDYYMDYFGAKRFILQEFVDGLAEDWKVLIFGEKFYVLNRKIREGDFRASGSGNLYYEEAPKEVLDYANKCRKKLDSPILSLDICMNKDNKCSLIEFQATHFGPYTLLNSEYYYTFKNNKWEKIMSKSDLSEEYIRSILEYLN